MVIEKIQELSVLQAKAAKLQAAIETERTAELAALPGKYGYDSVKAFIKALKAAAGGAKRRRQSSFHPERRPSDPTVLPPVPWQ